MAMTTIDELFEHELRDMYWAEQRLVDALDEMATETVDRDAKKAFQQHRKETQGQIKRLDRVFKALGQKPEAEPCMGMEGLMKEKKTFMKEKPSEEILSFYDLQAGQKVERYEITAYESLIDIAEQLGHGEVVELLQQTLEEEEGMLNRLKQLASEYEVEPLAEGDEEEAETTVTAGRGRR